jgi:DNA repair protein RadC
MWSGDEDARPRERLLRRGPRELSDTELLAVVLRNGRSGENAVELARALLGDHGDVRGLAAARADLLADVAGMGPAKAAAVAAAFELGRRTTELAEAVPLRRAADVADVARREARGVRRDELVTFVTDVACRVRWTVSVATGVLTTATAPIGRILDVVRSHGGAGFALARFTTESDAVPSAVDNDLARRLRTAATYAGLHFHDYVILADAGWCGVIGGPPLILGARGRAGPGAGAGVGARAGIRAGEGRGGVTERPAGYDARAGPGSPRPGRRQLS